MFVFPLGLGTKLRRWPIATVAIALLWIGVMVSDRSSDRITEILVRLSADRGVRDVSRALFVQYCKARKGDDKACRRYSLLVWTGFPGKSNIKAPVMKGKNWFETAKRLTAAVREQRQAEEIRRQLKNCRQSRQCFVYKDIVWRFQEQERNNLAAFDGLRAYPAYFRAMRAYKSDLRTLCRQLDCLISTNINLPAIGMAQLRHGSYMHLFGNLLAFVIFGIYVEQRTRRLLYVAVLVLGGTFGMMIHARFFGSADTLVLGGSANVSAVMGMFYVFFFHKKMRLQVWLPRRAYLGTAFYAEVKYCFPLFFVLSDVSGGFDSGFSSLLTGRVAHFAHLAGLGFGMIAALIIVKMWRLPRALIYEQEIPDLKSLAGSGDMDDVLSRSRRLLSVNPDNTYAMKICCMAYLKWLTSTRRQGHETTFDNGKLFLLAHLQSFCAIQVRQGDLQSSVEMLRQVPIFMPFRLYLGKLGQLTSLKLGDYALVNGDPLLAFRLYDFYLSRYQLAQKGSTVEETAYNIIGALAASKENVAAMRGFLASHAESLLADRVAAWLANVAPEGVVA